MSYGDIDWRCPDCFHPNERGGTTINPCGLTKAEHKRLRKLRKQAERRAHQLVVDARERELLPRALIKEVYDQAERDVRRRG